MLYIVRLFWDEPEVYQFSVLADSAEEAEELATQWLEQREIWVRGEYPDDEVKAYPMVLPDKEMPVVPMS